MNLRSQYVGWCSSPSSTNRKRTECENANLLIIWILTERAVIVDLANPDTARAEYADATDYTTRGCSRKRFSIGLETGQIDDHRQERVYAPTQHSKFSSRCEVCVHRCDQCILGCLPGSALRCDDRHLERLGGEPAGLRPGGHRGEVQRH